MKIEVDATEGVFAFDAGFNGYFPAAIEATDKKTNRRPARLRDP